jgi:hypothetical protein
MDELDDAAEYVGPASYTNRELLDKIKEELDLDGALDDEVCVSQILDMGAIHHHGFARQYMLMIDDDVRWMRQEEAARAAVEQGEHLHLVKDD